MSFSVALAGKGGTGKTTLAGLLVKYLSGLKKGPVLAVDADANANLNEVLGVPVDGTLGEAREDMKKGNVPSGMTKDVFMEMRLMQAIAEADGFDLVVMGLPEGSGCYCAANSLLAGFLEKLTGNYPFLVMDNEAGMEHISRLTTKNVDVLLIVSDSSRRGIQAAVRIHELARELKITAGKTFLVVNQVKGELHPKVVEIVKQAGLEIAGVLPADDLVYEYDFEGKPTVELPADSPFVQAASAVFEKITGNGAMPG